MTWRDKGIPARSQVLLKVPHTLTQPGVLVGR
jgi:hypothetical protein